MIPLIGAESLPARYSMQPSSSRENNESISVPVLLARKITWDTGPFIKSCRHLSIDAGRNMKLIPHSTLGTDAFMKG